jgi:tetratricopeptide (TPR) repeat protein
MQLFQQSLESVPDFMEARRGLGDVLAKLDFTEEAIEHYETSLRIALKGRSQVFGNIATDCGRRRLLDGDHARTYSPPGRLYARRGQMARAINGYRIAIGGGFDNAGSHAGLGFVYCRQGEGRQAAGEFFAAARRTPSSLVQFLSDLRGRSELRLKAVFCRDQYGFAG